MWRKKYLESSNDAHPKTGGKPKHEPGFIQARFDQAVLLSQPLHILVSGVYGGSSWANVTARLMQSQRKPCFHFQDKKGKCV